MTRAIALRTWGNPRLPRILLCHGFWGDSSDWEDLAESWSKDFHLVAIDWPGHGASPDPEASPWDEGNAFFEVLRSRLDECSGGFHGAFGYSMGARLLLSFMDQTGWMPRTLVLESFSPGLVEGPEKTRRLSSDLALAERIRREGLHSFLDFWYGQDLFQGIQATSGWEGLRQRRLRARPEGLARALDFFGTGRMPFLGDAFARLRIPTMLLAGERDAKMIGRRTELETLRSAVEWVTVEGASHNVHEAAPLRVARSTARFWKSI